MTAALDPRDVQMVDDVMFLMTASAARLNRHVVERCREICEDEPRARYVLATMTGIARDAFSQACDRDPALVAAAIGRLRPHLEVAVVESGFSA